MKGKDNMVMVSKTTPIEYPNGVQIAFPPFQHSCAVIGNHIYTQSGFWCRRDRVVEIALRLEDVPEPIPGEYYMERVKPSSMDVVQIKTSSQLTRESYTHIIQIGYDTESGERLIHEIEVRGEDSALHLITDLLQALGDEMETQGTEKREWPQCHFVRKKTSEMPKI